MRDLHKFIRILLALPIGFLAFSLLALLMGRTEWVVRNGQREEVIRNPNFAQAFSLETWAYLVVAAVLGFLLFNLYNLTSFAKRWNQVEKIREAHRQKRHQDEIERKEQEAWEAGAETRQQESWEYAIESAVAAEFGKDGQPINYRHAFDLRLEVAKEGCPEARVLVGRSYIFGKGVDANVIEGLAWLYFAGEAMSADDRRLMQEIELRVGHHGVAAAQSRVLKLANGDWQATPSTPSLSSPSVPSDAPIKGTGSGAVISVAGHVLTAAHVIEKASGVRIFLGTVIHEAKVLAVDVANDVALLQIEKAEGPFARLPLGQLENVRMGQSCCTIGFPSPKVQGSAPKCTDGIISSEDGPAGDLRLWQISCPIQPGNSGGPLLDQHGRLIGVVVSTLNSARFYEATGAIPQNVNYAIKAIYAYPMLTKHGIDITPGPVEALKFDEVVARSTPSCVMIQVY